MRKVGARERGSGLTEFVLCFALFWVPFFFGLWRVGLSIARAIQVTEVCRDAAHMAAYGINFTDSNNQAILQKVAQGLNLSASGSSVLILSTVTYVSSTNCTNAGLQANTSSCPNMDQDVFISRIVIGNTSVRASAFGTPSSSDIASDGTIAINTYLTDPTCRAVGFSNLMTLSSGQLAYLSEMTLISADLANAASSARSIF